VERSRLDSKRGATSKLAPTPHRFAEIRHRPGTSIIVPRHSSERREIIPMGFLDDRTVFSDAANAIYGAEPWLFALLQSHLHTAWAATVGGRIKTDYRYSATLCYNTFPLPSVGETDKARLTEHAFSILEARERHTEMSLGDMYLPDKMPADLRRVHAALDATVDALYGLSEPTDNERLEVLFTLYEQATAAAARAA
jgi:hypothetical protein